MNHVCFNQYIYPAINISSNNTQKRNKHMLTTNNISNISKTCVKPNTIHSSLAQNANHNFRKYCCYMLSAWSTLMTLVGRIFDEQSQLQWLMTEWSQSRCADEDSFTERHTLCIWPPITHREVSLNMMFRKQRFNAFSYQTMCVSHTHWCN